MDNTTNVLTVNKLLEKLTILKKSGYGEMKIRCIDNYLHDDELHVDYVVEEIQFRGHLFNYPITNKVRKFCEDIDEAREDFYSSLL